MNKWRKSVPLIVALIFVATLPYRHFRAPRVYHRHPVIRAIPPFTSDQWYKLPEPIVLANQGEPDQSASTDGTNNEDVVVRPAWVSFAITTALALHCILDDGLSVSILIVRFLLR